MGILGGLSGWEIGVIEGDGRWWRGRVGGCVISFGCSVSGGVLICSFGVCFEMYGCCCLLETEGDLSGLFRNTRYGYTEG